MVVEVPNIGSLSSRVKTLVSRAGLARRPFRHFPTFHHVNFFTPATLERLVARAGFQVLSVATPVKPGAPWVAGAARLLLGPLGLGSAVEAVARRPAAGEATP